MRAQRLTTIIFIGMLLGIGVGYACHQLWPDPQTAKTVAGYISCDGAGRLDSFRGE
jgi:Na+/H+-dicarboxylate symporter